jgi:transcriptional regulator with PAS, ATPase and Fis domain
MYRISGFSAEEVIGKSCTILKFDNCFGKKCPSNIEQCGIFTQDAFDLKECRLKHKEGYFVPILKSARVVMDNQNKAIGVVETITDMTELEATRKKEENASLRLGEMYRFGNIIGKSHVMQEVFQSIKAAASSHANIFISGESGTGKELVAGAIHYNSDRANKPLTIVNCAALSESILESELFGHVKGAFTGALRDRTGRFEEANGGTVFLDEIGEISPYIQIKLLRVIQEREIERVGESKRRKVDIRIFAATHRDIFSLVNEGLFREDLYYRLKVFPINVPPLRKRKEDIHLLIDDFIKRQNKQTNKNIKGINSNAMRVLMDYNWPGNVRELKNAIEHAFVLCNNDKIDIMDLPVEIRQMPSHIHQIQKYNSSPLNKHLTKESLTGLLNECQWNKAEVARRLNVSRTAVWKYMKKFDIPLQPEKNSR